MQQRRTWRELLLNILSDPLEYERLARAVGVPKITLMRWAIGETKEPRKYLLQQLLSAFEDETLRKELALSMQLEFPDITLLEEAQGQKQQREAPLLFRTAIQEIPSLFYDRAISAFASTPESVRFWSISQMILQQMLGQIDPQRAGSQISLLQCTEPGGDGKIHSLRECMLMSAPPHKEGSIEGITIQERVLFQGAESLAGFAILQGRYIALQEMAGSGFPLVGSRFEAAVAAFPILRTGNCAGCLTFSSAQVNFFSQERLSLILKYINLMALLFQDFYAPAALDLYAMPSLQDQQAHVISFRTRVTRLMQESASQHQTISNEQAIFRIRKELEEELFRASGTNPPPS